MTLRILVFRIKCNLFVDDDSSAIGLTFERVGQFAGKYQSLGC